MDLIRENQREKCKEKQTQSHALSTNTQLLMKKICYWTKEEKRWHVVAKSVPSDDISRIKIMNVYKL